MSESTYRADPRMNQSTIKLWLDHDPAIAFWMETHPKEATPAMKFGTVVHKLIETNLTHQIDVSPYSNFRTKEAKLWRDTHPDAMKQEDADKAINMATACLHKFPDIHNDGTFEEEFYSEREKALLDYVSRCRTYAIDWKTTSATSLEQFRKDAGKYNFEVQAAWYIRLSGVKDFFFVGISNVEPHPVFILKANRAALNHGEVLISKAIRTRNEYMQTLSQEKRESSTTTLQGAIDLWEQA